MKNKESGMELRSTSKINNQVRDLVEKEWVLEHIRRFRRECKIPAGGLPLPDHLADIGNPFYTPAQLKLAPNKRGPFLRRVNKGLKDLREGLSLRSAYLDQVLRVYIYHDRLMFDEISEFQGGKSALSMIRNLRQDLDEYIPTDDIDPDLAVLYVQMMKRLTEEHPVALLIHQDERKGSAVEALEATWDRIGLEFEHQRDAERPSIRTAQVTGKNKTREMRDFIYKNREMSNKRLMSALREEFKLTDDDIKDPGWISKMRSEEIKHRQRK